MKVYRVTEEFLDHLMEVAFFDQIDMRLLLGIETDDEIISLIDAYIRVLHYLEDSREEDQS